MGIGTGRDREQEQWVPFYYAELLTLHHKLEQDWKN